MGRRGYSGSDHLLPQSSNTERQGDPGRLWRNQFLLLQVILPGREGSEQTGGQTGQNHHQVSYSEIGNQRENYAFIFLFPLELYFMVTFKDQTVLVNEKKDIFIKEW